MRDNSCRESMERILQDAPTARKSLLDNHSNLHRVADYCQNKYINVENTTSVIEESKALTTQALASVTYQINNLATSLLKILDAQTLQLKQMESSVNMLSLTVDIYKENIARREIGVLTAQSKVPRVLKIVPPAAGKEPLRAYRRVPISFTRLDKLGHGHWENNKPEDSTDNRESFKQFSVQETSNFTWSFTGIAVPPPSVPDWVGSKVTASPDRSPASPSSFTLSVSSPSLTPYGFSDLSMLPPPPPPDNDTGDAPPPPPSPPASNMPSFPPNTYVTSAIPSPIQGNRSIPPPPPTPSNQNNMFVPPPPPPPPNQGNMSILPPPPPPPPNQGNMSILPPPPPPPPNQGNMSILPPPPPPNQGNMSNLPPPPPPPPNQGKTTVPPPPQSISMVPPPPPPPPTPGGKFVPPPPPPLPPFKC